MNQKIPALIASAVCALFTVVDFASAQGTAFTYQGQLISNGVPVNGNFDFVFELYNESANGTQQGGGVTNLAVVVSNGLFNVTNDFGAGPWTGQPLWIQLQVRTNNGGAFASLSPRQAVTSTPYAIQSLNASNAVNAISAGSAITAGTAGSVAAANITGVGTLPLTVLPGSVVTNTQTNVVLSGTFNGNGGGLTNLNASQLAVSPIGDFYIGEAGNSSTVGYGDNTAAGFGAFVSVTNGNDDTAYGTFALAANTTGSFNTADGGQALQYNQTGSFSVAVGYGALDVNSVGTINTAVGADALSQLGLQAFYASHTGGGTNDVALGVSAGYNYTGNESSNIDIGNSGTLGENKTIHIGDPAVHTNTFIAGMINGNGGGLTNLNASQLAGSSGNADFYLGNAGNSSTAGSGDNTAAGYGALVSISNANDDTAYGTFALSQNTTGSFNTADGGQALQYNQTGSFSVAVGYGALDVNSVGTINTAVGADALGQLGLQAFNSGRGAVGGGTNDVALGVSAGYNYTGNESSNIDIGNSGALGENNTIHIGDPAVHTNAFLAGIYGVNLAGSLPVFVNHLGQLGTNGNAIFSAQSLTLGGYLALPAADPVIYAGGGTLFFADVDGNTAAGLNTLLPNRGSGNVAFGQQALEANQTGGYNTAVGFQALAANTAPLNAGFGSGALLVNTTGQDNTALGTSTLYNSKTGSDNTAAGFQALYSNTNGAGNTALGFDAGYSVKSGSNNIALGYQAGYNLTGSSNIDIGNQGSSVDANTIRIGSNQAAAYIAGISGVTAAGGSEVFVNASGQLGTLTSSARFKQNIQTMANASDELLSLHPVTFQYRPEVDPQGIPQFGLVAEEVNRLDTNLVVRDNEGKILTVRYQAVNAMLLNEFLKEHTKVEKQSAAIKAQDARIEKLEKQVQTLIDNRGNNLETASQSP